MILFKVLFRRIQDGTTRRLGPPWFIALLAGAYAALLVAVGLIFQPTAFASQQYAEAPSVWARLADGGGFQT